MMKSLQRACLLMGIGVISAGFAACNDDDDNGSSNEKTVKSTIKDQNGNTVQVSRVGDCAFIYGTDGQLVGFSTDESTFAVQNNSLAFTDGKGTTITLSISDGLIRSIKAELKDVKEEDGYLTNLEGTMTISYNSSRQLVKASASSKGNSVNDKYGDKQNFNGSGTTTNTWTNNNLAKSVYKSSYHSSGTENGKSYSGTETYEQITTFAYLSQDNAARQLPFALTEAMELGEDIDVFAMLGLLGTGPAQLPVSYTKEWIEENDEPYSVTTPLYFVQNENGTINSESWGTYNTIRYYYNDEALEPVPDINPANAPVKAPRLTKSLLGLFPHK